ncbi:hypothetical protein DPM19_09760 [Actinomadura craniellae]|uniref:IrrE N-terminal-like domain-containing protein n=1 Tax=Actinomadura craniellae TaxID=2231787 RepID=A0A365H7E3_9ACTN|nr:ImmA/IrrE family metallo-endopeptidase [Actinomadura craniellae]RAY15025.1 hypothetical protein DPM19_09760 [Actinomadura craniellae]
MARWTKPAMKEVAAEERAALGLTPMQRFDPYMLAKEHGISVYPIGELIASGCSPDAVKHFEVIRPKVWSAALMPVGSARFMLVNTGHELVRQRSNMAHELGHHLLEHEFQEIVLGDDGCAMFNATLEKQATYLAQELLVPEDAAFKMAFRDQPNEAVAEHFGVSVQFAQMCMMGPRKVVQRYRAKKGR